MTERGWSSGAPLGGGHDMPTGTHVGNYRLVERVAAGGMGVVYRAERADDQYRKQVAVKVLRPERFLAGAIQREESLRRFRAERQILAELEHPGIARLLDGGTTADGIPYLVMEFVEGQPIDDHCDARRLGTSARLELFAHVCDAVAYAHAHLVVHRDLKPGNILVTPSGTPRLLDFGIAKLIEEPGPDQTRTIGQPMTPEYASPEQWRQGRITTATDVYSAGVVLYELLTGHRPHRVGGRPVEDAARVVREDEPERPSAMVMRVEEGPATDAGEPSTLTPEGVSRTREGSPERLRRRLAGDVDMIVLKALRKEPERRYGSMQALAEDIRRHLRGLPVSARPDTLRYRAVKFLRRHAGGVAIVAGVMLLLASAGAVVGWSALRTRQAERRFSGFLGDLLTQADPYRSLGGAAPATEPWTPHILKEAARRLEELRDEPEIYGRLLHTLGEVESNMGLHELAQPHLEEAVALRRRERGPDDRQTLESALALALVLAERGELGPAERMLSEVRDALAATAGPTDAATLRAAGELAGVLRKMRRYTEAEQLFQDTLEASRRVLGPEHPSTLTTMSGLASLYSELGPPWEQARSLHQQALDGQLRIRGPEHPETLISMNNLALLYARLGEHAESQAMYEQTLQIMRRVVGLEHPGTLSVMNNLAISHQQQGMFALAKPLLEEALRLRRARSGPEHRSTLGVTNSLAINHARQGRPEEAEAIFGPLLETSRRALGEEDPFTLTVASNRAETLKDLGRSDEALALQRLACDGFRRARGADHPDTLRVMHRLGALLLTRHELEESEQVLAAVLELRRHKLGPANAETRASRDALFDLYLERGRPDDAEMLLRQDLCSFESAFGPDDARTIELRWRLRDLCAVGGR
jgi:serine/threonine-protein kinase